MVLRVTSRYLLTVEFNLLFPLAARSKAWFCGFSFTGIVGSNHGGVMDVCHLEMLRDVRQSSLLRADHSSRKSYRLCSVQ